MAKEKKLNFFSCIFNGIITENPTLILMIGMCPTLAVTTSLSNAIGMGLSTTAVLVASNALISAVRKITPDRVRIPIYIVIVASLVTLIEFVIKAFFPFLYDSLGIYIPLIVVNCIILGRAEAFASKNNVTDSIMDAIGISAGFLMAMVVVAFFREVLGTGAISFKNLEGVETAKLTIIPAQFTISLLNQPAGAFLVLGFCVAGFTAINSSVEAKKKAKAKAAAAANTK